MVLILPRFSHVAGVLGIGSALLLTLGVVHQTVVSQVFAATYSVTITDDQFVPSTLKVKVSDSVTFINSTDATQSARTSSSTGFNTGNIGPGASKTVTLTQAGTFSYSSTQDSTLTGTVTVESSAGTGGLATGSATTTTTTTKGGQLPESGTTEVLLGMLALGGGLVLFGGLSGRWSFLRRGNIADGSLVDLETVRSRHTQE